MRPATGRVPSGLPWLGDVPAHWTVAPLRARFSVQLGKMLDEKRFTGAHSAPYLRNVDVQWDRVNMADLPVMDFSPEDRRKYELRPGDVLVCEGGEVGRAAVWRGDLGECYYQKALHRVRALGDDDPRFLYYALMAAAKRGAFEAGSNTSTIGHLTAEKLRAHRFAFPPPDEQRSLVAYLDAKCGAIDALVAQRRDDLTTVDERARAVRTRHIAAAGAPPVRLRQVVPAVEQGWSPECENRPAAGTEWGVLKAGCANGAVFREDEHKALLADLAPDPTLEVAPGDLLISRANTRDLVGSVALVRACRPRLLLCDKLFRLRYDAAQVDPAYLAHALAADATRAQIERAASGSSSSMLNIGQRAVRDLVVPLPPLPEQRTIAARIDQALAENALLAAEYRRQAGLLDEYRTALVVAGVSGRLAVTALSPTAASKKLSPSGRRQLLAACR